MKLLLAEDERRMAQALMQLLRLENYKVDWVADGEEALTAIECSEYDVIVLDVMLPNVSGFEIAAAARQKGVTTPILMLTAKSELDDKVKGLDSGADDYLTKPFMTKELLARLRALTRRNAKGSDGIMTYGDIMLDTNKYIVTCKTTGQNVRLSEKEFKILEYLISNKGMILTREQFAVRLWGFDSEAEYNNVEVYMSFTRKKLKFIGAETQIKSVRKIGYELRYNDV